MWVSNSVTQQRYIGRLKQETSRPESTRKTKYAIMPVVASKLYRWIIIFSIICLTLFTVYRHYGALKPVFALHQSTASKDVNWSRFAYTQYVTDSDYLCNSVMFFALLHKFGSKADRLLMYPSEMLDWENDRMDTQLLIKARDLYDVKLVPITVKRKDSSHPTWADSFTKLLAFNQTQYDRVLSIDSDALLLQPMDELFLLPPSPIAMPRAYWLLPDNAAFSTHIMLIEPSESEFTRVMTKVDQSPSDLYDMEIINELYHDTAMTLPHRPYALLTGEFRGDDHKIYLGTAEEVWDPVAVYNEAKLAHFSDWPAPKPWYEMEETMRDEIQPKCIIRSDGVEDCISRGIWNNLYRDFKELRQKTCRSV